MCGRYASTRSSVDLATLFEALDETQDQLRPDYNLAPTDPAPIVRRSERVSSPVLSAARWGLVPPWSADATRAARMINARAETVATSPSFRQSFRSRRCLVPADGWYEWSRVNRSTKQAFFMTRNDGEPIIFGGIWSTWNAGSTRLLTFSVVTLPAAGEFAGIHDRMPLVLDPAHWQAWLTVTDPEGMLVSPPPEYAAGIECRPVSAAVGDVRNDGPDLIRAVPDQDLLRSHVEPPETLF